MKNTFQAPVAPVVPDHQLIRRIGEGSYGEVWLAKNILGTYRAVKILYRARFADERPYEREFEGIQKFEPISRSHPGLVDVLQIGRNDNAGYFYYVMELADDEVTGSTFDPESYSAKTLAKHISGPGRLPAAESILLGQNLAAALAYLHTHGLVHRDVKPSNIIFVDGEPKLADIGLVALATAARTYVGTEGYIPPEGPGSIQADIYSLGMVLFEIGMGRDRSEFPELPPNILHFSDADLVIELNEVVVKACASLPSARYLNAQDMRSDLLMLSGGRSVQRLRFVERQLCRVKRFAMAATALAVVAVMFSSVVTTFRAREKRLLANALTVRAEDLVRDNDLVRAIPFYLETLRLQENDPLAVETNRVKLRLVLQEVLYRGSAIDGAQRDVNELEQEWKMREQEWKIVEAQLNARLAELLKKLALFDFDSHQVAVSGNK